MEDSLAGRVKARLEALGMNATSAAKAGKLERNFILDILAGRKKSPRADNMRKLAAVLETSVTWLTDGSEETAAGPPPRPLSNLTPYRSELIDLTLGMTEEDARALVQVARRMLDMHTKTHVARAGEETQS